MEENLAWFILGAALAIISFIYADRWKRINRSNRIRKYSGRNSTRSFKNNKKQ